MCAKKEVIIKNAKKYIKVVAGAVFVGIVVKELCADIVEFVRKYKSYDKDETIEDIFVEE